jgi:signal transduction histidine kinase
LQESKIKNYEGDEIPVALSGATLKKDGEAIGTVMFFQDLSMIKQLQKEILEAERLTAVGQTVAGLSHGLKNIVMGLEGGMYVSTSGIRRSDNSLVKEGLRMLQDNIEKISSFVRGILSFAKGAVPKVELVEPCSIASDIVCLYDDAAKRSGIKLVAKLQKDLDKAPMDTQGIHTCIANLVSNAMDACLLSDTKNPTVTLAVFQKNNTLFYEVKDNGCGMDYEVKKKIFTSFFTTKEPGSGTGVGLLTSRKIVHDHGGKISVNSTLGKGSVFRIELPRHRLPLPEEAKKSL